MPLGDLRKQIDEMDLKLVELLNARARIVQDIGKLKNKDSSPIYAPDREKAVLDKSTILSGWIDKSGPKSVILQITDFSFAILVTFIKE